MLIGYLNGKKKYIYKVSYIYIIKPVSTVAIIATSFITRQQRIRKEDLDYFADAICPQRMNFLVKQVKSKNHKS